MERKEDVNPTTRIVRGRSYLLEQKPEISSIPMLPGTIDKRFRTIQKYRGQDCIAKGSYIENNFYNTNTSKELCEKPNISTPLLSKPFPLFPWLLYAASGTGLESRIASRTSLGIGSGVYES